MVTPTGCNRQVRNPSSGSSHTTLQDTDAARNAVGAYQCPHDEKARPSLASNRPHQPCTHTNGAAPFPPTALVLSPGEHGTTQLPAPRLGEYVHHPHWHLKDGRRREALQRPERRRLPRLHHVHHAAAPRPPVLAAAHQRRQPPEVHLLQHPHGPTGVAPSVICRMWLDQRFLKDKTPAFQHAAASNGHRQVAALFLTPQVQFALQLLHAAVPCCLEARTR